MSKPKLTLALWIKHPMHLTEREHRELSRCTRKVVWPMYTYVGIHHLLNVVTSGADDPQCVLIRAIEPLTGIDVMASRRSVPPEKPIFSNGPGSAAKALGIDSSFNGAFLTDDSIWIEDQGLKYSPAQIGKAARIGIDYAQEHAALPLRFFIKESKYARK